MQIAGRVGINPIGEWEPDVQYSKLDLVTTEYGTYLAKKGSLGIPTTNTEYWMQLTLSGGGGASSISELEDLDLTGLSDKYCIYYDDSSSSWKVGAFAWLDSNGRIPYSIMPETAMEYMGTWDASTNTPTLTQGSGTNGFLYIVSVAGTWSGIEFSIGDRIIFDGNSHLWQKLPGSQVSSVAGKTGSVSLNASDIGAGTLAGKVVANSTSVGTLTDSQVRNIMASTTDLTAGVSELNSGDIYIVYE